MNKYRINFGKNNQQTFDIIIGKDEELKPLCELKEYDETGFFSYIDNQEAVCISKDHYTRDDMISELIKILAHRIIGYYSNEESIINTCDSETVDMIANDLDKSIQVLLKNI